MGWNDRLPEDPFIPSSDYYQEQDRYEAWLEYITARAMEADQLTSQNIDPAQLHKPIPQETPARQGIFSRLWAQFFANQDHQKHTDQKQRENEVLPF